MFVTKKRKDPALTNSPEREVVVKKLGGFQQADFLLADQEKFAGTKGVCRAPYYEQEASFLHLR
jgi:hypothetical protein